LALEIKGLPEIVPIRRARRRRLNAEAVIRFACVRTHSCIDSLVKQETRLSHADSRPDALALLAAAGDTAAVAELLRVVAPAMLRVVRGVMGPRSADVDDALQQSLISLIHALPAFRGECSPAGYACRIAFRVALVLRKRARRDHAERELLAAAEGAHDSLPPGHALEAARRTSLLRALLDELPAEQAEALALRTILGWSREEIASASGVPLNTVRSRLRLAKEALRRKIAADPTLAEELGVGP
jgi:RNA polymerase sigma-70 factor (ECF subfamily)